MVKVVLIPAVTIIVCGFGDHGCNADLWLYQFLMFAVIHRHSFIAVVIYATVVSEVVVFFAIVTPKYFVSQSSAVVVCIIRSCYFRHANILVYVTIDVDHC